MLAAVPISSIPSISSFTPQLRLILTYIHSNMAATRCTRPGCNNWAVTGSNTCHIHWNSKPKAGTTASEPEQVATVRFVNITDWELWVKADGQALKLELQQLASQVNLQCLSETASALRSGIGCVCDPIALSDGPTNFGGRHYHITIHFDDGVKWIARISRDHVGIPGSPQRERVLLSEVATMNFLRHNTKVSVPAVHDFALAEDGKGVGVNYILMDYVDGQPMRLEEATIEQQERSSMPILSPSIGSLTLEKPEDVGPLIHDDVADFNSTGNLVPLGPFTDATEYYKARIELVTSFICRRQLYARNPADGYLLHRYLADSIVSTPVGSGSSGVHDSRFYLKHMDDKGDQILVDRDFNIVSVIDWEWAQTCPREEAFAAPLGLVEVIPFYEGDNSLSGYEQTFVKILEAKGRGDLADLVRMGRRTQRLDVMIGGDIEDVSFKELFSGYLKLDPAYTEKCPSWEEWKAAMLLKYGGDEDLAKLLQEQAAAEASN
ncbi:hypothetical protein A0H81_00783 [Grifola frondosa]|uniref:Aminoglycoside phosphotransferase domain-containing protein n=1 Tax=Grifola frondosa TaxID=5627 RepID=A0A1C7MP77_GRIFR|nr:hypothetical protein A0H81_00783 [Grifola frondosa]